MLSFEENVSPTKARSKMRALARSCGWMSTVLQQQDHILALLDGLSASTDEPSWDRRRAALDSAVQQLFRVDEIVLAPAVEAMGQRAHAVIADMCRRQIRRSLDNARWPSMAEDGASLRDLRRRIASYFTHDESWCYVALARHLDDHANAAMTTRCLAVASGTADVRDDRH